MAHQQARNKDIEGQFPKDGGGDHSVNERKIPKTILDPQGKLLQSWNVIFLLSCVISVLLDPLFFYLPVINEDKKCIGLDKKLWITAIVLRSVTDIIYLMHIIFQFRTGFINKEREKLGKGLNTDAWEIAKRYLGRYFLIDILAILPIPQVVISSIFSEMRRTNSSHKMIPLNSAILFQYVPRVLLIYLSWRELTRSNEEVERTIWFKAALNFFLYLIAGHVLGAFWYFFSTQRLTSCWHKSCEIHTECVRSSFNCDHSLGNHSFLNDFCPINTPNATLFDFGIFVDALQSGIVKSSDFPQKLFFCFWWGMQNLSSLGQNLKTSNYVWENLFALFISITGLFLFLYFVGNLQMYMLLKNSKSAEARMKMKSKKRTKQKETIDLWISKHKLSDDIKRPITEDMNQRFQEDEDVYLENLLPNLDGKVQDKLKKHICLNQLKTVEALRGVEEQLLLNLCQCLKPMFYEKHDYIIREGDPIDTVFLITDGTAFTYTNPTINNDEGAVPERPERLVKGQCFGVELLQWVKNSSTFCRKNLFELPVSSKTLKAHTEVEAFALMADDLRKKWRSKYSRLDPEQSVSEAATFVQQVWRRNHPKATVPTNAVV